MSNLQQQLARLSPEKQQLLAQLLRKKSKSIDAYPLSSEQRRLWFLDRLEPGVSAYNLSTGLRLRGALDVDALVASLRTIVRRHEVLRTSFIEVDGLPQQVITPWQDGHQTELLTVPLVDLSDLPAGAQAARVSALAQQEAQTPFELGRGPLFRTMLLRLAAHEHVLLLTMHHIITDAWSIRLFFEELAALYHTGGQESATLPELPIQYVDYARWQQDWYASPAYAQQLAFWKDQLAGAPPLLELPADRPRPAAPSYSGATLTVLVPRTLLEGLKALGQREGATLFMTLFAAFNVLLGRSSGQDDLLVGTPVANRRRREVEPLIGFFVNTLVLRTRLNPALSFRALLAQVRDTALNAYQHQEMPLDRLIDELRLERDLSYAPLAQVMFALQNAPAADLRLDGLTIEALESEHGTAKFDLLLSAEECPEGLLCAWEYSTDLFDRPTVERMAARFVVLLHGLVATPDRPIGLLPLLPADEQTLLLDAWTNTASPFPLEASLPALFLAQVERTPDAVAVHAPDRRLTYRQLAEQARHMAAHLRAAGVGPDALVAVLAERGAGFLTAVLATFIAGGAYLPLDPRHPPARLRQVLAQSRPALALATPALCDTLAAALDELPPSQCPPVAVLDELLAAPAPPVHWPELRPDQLAYIIYTSGSTGTPKGVMVEARGMINHLFVKIQDLQLTAADVVAQSASQCFDISVWQFLAALVVGGTVVVLPDAVAYDPAALLPALLEHQITIVELVPALLRTLLEQPALPALPLLRWMIPTGEALPPDVAARWLATYPDIPLLNAYGPTECSDDVTHAELRIAPPLNGSPVPIGRAVANMRLYILDRMGQPVPIGVTGELWVGGVGVGRGYQNDPARTAAAFGPDPYGPPGARRYRTGDLGRWRADGQIEYLGRIDHQVKVRGYRVEQGEIEALLAQHPAVGASVVLARPSPSGDARLVAYVVFMDDVAHGPGLIDPLLAYLAERLPEYMVPAAIVVLDRLPLTANGKVDRAALPEPDWTARSQGYVAPRTPVEQALAKIWSDVLRVPQVGIHDNFFALGGDSILSIQVVARANAAQLRLAPRQLFQHQTIAELAQVALALAGPSSDQSLVTGPLPLTPIQQQFFEQPLRDRHHWNQAVSLELREPLDPALLEQALGRLIEHHDALRLRFTQSGSGWQQQIIPPDGQVALSVVDLSGLPVQEQERRVADTAAAIQAGLDLTSGPLLRAALFQGGALPARLMIVIHHLATDGVSWQILLGDLETLYRQLRANEPPSLPAKTMSYKAWAERLVQHAGSASVQQELPFWRDQLLGATRLPRDLPAGSNTGATARRFTITLGAEETRALLHDAPRAYNTQINDLLLAALVLACSEWTGSPRLLIALENHGRVELDETIDLSRTVGWFTALFPLLLERASDPTATLRAVKEQLRHIPNQGIGYGLLRYLAGQDKVATAWHRLPQPELVFNYIGQTDRLLPAGSLFAALREGGGLNQSQHAERRYLLNVVGQITDERLQLDWIYSEQIHHRETIAALAARFTDALLGLITHCTTAETPGWTPSDFPLAQLSQTDLNTLLAQARRIGGTHSIADVYPLSPTQQGMLFHTLYEPALGTYFEQVCVTFEGLLDHTHFARCWQALIERHAVLRTAFVWADLPEPLQVVYRTTSLPLAIHDWRATPEEQRNEHLLALLRDERAREFDLRTEIPFRLTLIQAGDSTHHVVVTFHHLIMDGWSVPVLFKEFFALYETRAAAVPLAATRPYRDYIAWLRAKDRAATEQFWRGMLRGFRTTTPLGASQPLPAPNGQDSYGRERVVLSEATTSALQQLARRHHLTLNTLVLGAWSLVLGAHSHQDDLLLGITLAGRPAELERIDQTVGMFINTLPLRIRLDRANGLWEWLQQLQQLQTELRQFEHSALVDVHGWSEVPRRQPLFESIFVFENYPVDQQLLASERSLSVRHFRFIDQASYPLSVLALPGPQLAVGAGFDRRRFDDAAITALLQAIRAVLEQIAAQPASTIPALLGLAAPAARRLEVADPEPLAQSNLTRHQLMLWIGDRLHQGRSLYHLHGDFFIPFAVDTACFQQAFQQVITCSDALRTVIVEEQGVPQRRVLDTLCYQCEQIDLSQHPDPQSAIDTWTNERFAHLYQPGERLFDAALFRLPGQRSCWALHLHHIIFDGVAFIALFEVLKEYYRRALQGKPLPDTPLPPFQHYIEAERALRSSERYQQAATFWREHLAEPAEPLNFYGRTRRADATAMQTRHDLLDDQTRERLGLALAASGSGGVTSLGVVAAILCAYLARVCQQRSLTIGIPFHNRTREFRQTLGFFMQIIPLRVTVAPEDTFVSLIEQIGNEFKSGLRYSQYVVENPVHAPHYEVTLNFHKDYRFSLEDQPIGYRWVHPPHGSETLVLHVHEAGSAQDLGLVFDFNQAVFPQGQQDQAIGQFRQIVAAFLEDPNRRIESVDLLTPAEQEQLLVAFNHSAQPFPHQQTFAELFAAQVARSPDALAVRDASGVLTYRELDEQSSRLAQLLRRHGAGPECVVGLLHTRSTLLLTAILAVFKAGAAYLPLDPQHPPQRQAQILGQSGCPLVLAGDALLPQAEAALALLPADVRPMVLPLAIPAELSEERLPVAQPQNLAYVIYTSGSTGQPKGAMISQLGMINHLYAKISDLALGPGDLVAQTASQCFDISVWQFLAVLLAGGCVQIVDDATTHDPAVLARLIADARLTVVELVPSLLQVLLDGLELPGATRPDFSALRWMIMTGEALPPALARRWLGCYPAIPLLNAYGPTECSDDVTHALIQVAPPDQQALLPIGRPVANTQLYILDRQLRPLPLGVPGELFVGGAGVGRGYLNDPARTAEVFVPNPFYQCADHGGEGPASPSTRLYKTGDLARFLPDGAIEFLGRIDHQVKIRGFRIELGEIEAALLRHPAVRMAVVLAREDRPGDKRLVAYVVPKLQNHEPGSEAGGWRLEAGEHTAQHATLKTYLAEQLPDYMVPSALVMLPELPLTPNGKIDRRALPAPAASSAERPLVAPRDPLECRLADVWETLLEHRPISVTDSFFEIGGHSILAVRMMLQASKLAGRELPLATLFQAPTIEQLARVIRSQEAGTWSSLVPIQPHGSRRPFFCAAPHGGGTLTYYQLAKHLGPDQPFYGLQAPGLDGEQEPFQDIPQLAAHYLRVIRQVQPEGPYQLGGHSFGGRVAYEMALQLHEQGEAVSFLGLFDTGAPVYGNVPFGRNGPSAYNLTESLLKIVALIARLVRQEIPLTIQDLAEHDTETQMQIVLDHLKAVNFFPPDTGMRQMRGLLNIHHAHSLAVWKYLDQARPYSGQATLFLAEEVLDQDFRSLHRELSGDPTLGWEELLEDRLTICRVPGDHVSMLAPPHVATFAAQLRMYLDQAELLCVETSEAIV